MKTSLIKNIFVSTFLVVISQFALADKGPKSGSPEQAKTHTVLRSTLSAKGAQDIADAIEQFALSRNQSVTVAIVDAGGDLLFFKRMDGWACC